MPESCSSFWSFSKATVSDLRSTYSFSLTLGGIMDDFLPALFLLPEKSFEPI